MGMENINYNSTFSKVHYIIEHFMCCISKVINSVYTANRVFIVMVAL